MWACVSKFLIYCGLFLGLCFGSVITAGAQTVRDYPGPNMNYAYSGPRITFEEVFARPDDAELNLNYAQQQAAKGDLFGAASALERLLYIEPNWHSARLFYAGVLYRLDDKIAAKTEMDILAKEDLNPSQQAQLETYQIAFDFAPPVTAEAGLSGELALGLDRPIATNRPLSDSFDAQDRPIRTVRRAPSSDSFSARASLSLRSDSNAEQSLVDITSLFGEQSDFSVNASGAARKNWALPGQENIFFMAGINGQIRRHFDSTQADFSTFGGASGLYFSHALNRVFIGVSGDLVDISGERYLKRFGPKFTASREIKENTFLSLSLSYFNQDYSALSFAPLENLRSGGKGIMIAQIDTTLPDQWRVVAQIGTESKTADVSAFEYSALRLGVAVEKPINPNWLLTGSVQARQLDYKPASIGSVVPGRDKEDRLNARLAVSTPLAHIIPVVETDALALEMAVHHDMRSYNDGRNDFNNTGFELRLNWEY